MLETYFGGRKLIANGIRGAVRVFYNSNDITGRRGMKTKKVAMIENRYSMADNIPNKANLRQSSLTRLYHHPARGTWAFMKFMVLEKGCKLMIKVLGPLVRAGRCGKEQ